jgi:2,4-dienoyl-CoA reductase-like NADH-dependent reductase (Old Yellow Enzyme family)
MNIKVTKNKYTLNKSNISLKNRIVLAPLTHNMSKDNGDLSPDEIAWLAQCSKGGFGMLITAATSVSNSGRSWKGQPSLTNDSQIDQYKKIAQTAVSNHAITIVQLHHGGLRTDRQLSHSNPVSPSDVKPDNYHPDGVSELKPYEIEVLISDFVNAAKRAYKAGINGVEIHAAFNFLLSNFSNPIINKRTDKWGGSFTKRNRIIFDIVRIIKDVMPREFIVGVRLSPENYAHYKGIEINEQIDLANELNQLGVDYIHMSLYDAFKQPNHLKKTNQTLLQWIKSHLNPNITLIIAGKISTAEEADWVISHGADLIAIGQSAVGNPDWVNKVNNGEELILKPYSQNHLSNLGFTQQSIDYLKTISGLVENKSQKFGTIA